MQTIVTEIADVLLIEPRVFNDERGSFFECYQRERYAEAGIAADFVQDNYSRSRAGVLRGLHYQLERPQAKLVTCTRGRIFDVVVDLRRSSPTLGRSVAMVLDDQSRHQLYVPAGFAHGFLALTEAEVVYKCTDYYFPQHERTLLWNDAQLSIAWPTNDPLLSLKDRQGLRFHDAPLFA
jgi:dTDP-4-dehydrorhamnose 3,5-epimerase